MEEELINILKKPISEEAEYEFVKKIFPMGAYMYNVSDEDAKKLYLISKLSLDLGELTVNWEDRAKKNEVKLKGLLNSFNVDPDKIIY